MLEAITPKYFWASGGMADTPVLGTGLARGGGSSPLSPTSKSNKYWNKFCCTSCCIEEEMLHNGVGELLGQLGSGTLVSLRIYTPIIITFISAYSSSIATAFFKYNIICTSE